MDKSYYFGSGFSQLPRPETFFPLIRQISYRVSPVLARAGFTPNQVTFVGLIAGIAGALSFAQGSHGWGLSGAFLWAICNLMDYCDGEVARITGNASRYGAIFDDIVDWIVHASFFTGLGLGAEVITDDSLWFWFGVAAAVGSTINLLVNWLREWLRDVQGEPPPRVPGEPVMPEDAREKFLYIFRGLFRADFWLLVIVVELFHVTWLLLPVFAIGTQVFWITGFMKGADKFVP